MAMTIVQGNSVKYEVDHTSDVSVFTSFMVTAWFKGVVAQPITIAATSMQLSSGLDVLAKGPLSILKPIYARVSSTGEWIKITGFINQSTVAIEKNVIAPLPVSGYIPMDLAVPQNETLFICPMLVGTPDIVTAVGVPNTKLLVTVTKGKTKIPSYHNYTLHTTMSNMTEEFTYATSLAVSDDPDSFGTP